MPSVFAIVSKKVFEKDAAGLGPGDIWETSAYLSKHKGLAPVESGGSLYLVTVRPPDEKLWLVAVLDGPKKKKDGYHAAKNTQPIVEISGLRSSIVFEAGKGMSQKKGALGMSLQTPRALAVADVTLIDKTLGKGAKKATKKKATKKKATKKSASKADEPTKASPKTVEVTGPVRFSDDARKYLSPRAADELPKQKTQKKLWRDLREAVRPEIWDKDASVSAFAASLDPVLNREEPESLEVDAWAAMIAAGFPYNAHKTVGYIVERVDLETALEMLIRAHDFAVLHGQKYSVVEGEGDPRRPKPPYIQDVFWVKLLRDDRAGYDALLTRATGAFEGGDMNLRLTMLSCFPEQSEWANALAKEWLTPANPPPHGRDTLLSSVTDPKLAVQIVQKAGLSGSIVDLVRLVGEDAVPLLAEMLGGKRFPNEQKAISRALACIHTQAAADLFAKHLRKKNVRPFASEFYASEPELAEVALASLAKKKTQVGGVARDILERVARAVKKKSASPVDVASDDDVPEILQSPPWHRGGKKPRAKKPKVVEGVAIPREPTRLHWSAHARLRRMASNPPLYWATDPEALAADTRRRLEEGDERVPLSRGLASEFLLPLLEDPPDNLRVAQADAIIALTRLGEPALEAVLRAIEREGPRTPIELLLKIESPRLAAAWLNPLADEWQRPNALSWIHRYPETAALGLVPATLAAELSVNRRGGAVGLRYLKRLGHEARLRELAAAHGSEAEAIVDEILAFDERLDCPTKPPKMPKSFRPAELRAPRLTNGQALPQWAVERLGEMLRFSSTELPYVGIDEVRRACDPKSLAEFAWDLAQVWDMDGAKDTHDWMLHAVEHYGDDEVVRRLTPALKGEGIAKMLGRIGTDAAVMELGTIIARCEESGRTPKYAYGMHDAMRRAAAIRGLEPFELQERYVPTCEVDAEGGIDLDFGTRRFRVGFDAGLRPVLRDGADQAVKMLPRAAKGDDVEKVKKAHALWTDLREDVAVIAAQRARGACQAMHEQRTWSAAEFRRIYVGHPLMKHLARGIVWEAHGEGRAGASRFRVAEDGTLADIQDDLFELDGGARVGVAHSFEMTGQERGRWRETFDDYEIIQPFEQLRDPITTEIEDAELSGELRNLQLHKFYPSLRGYGWRSGAYQYQAGRLFPDELIGVLENRNKTSTLRGVVVRGGRPVDLRECSELVKSEMLYAMRAAEAFAD